MKKTVLSIFGVSLLLSGCGAKIHCVGVDSDSCQSSILKVKKSVKKEKREALENALLLVGLQGAKLENIGNYERQMYENIEGLNAKEVFDKAISISQKKLSDLEKQKAEYEKAQENFKKLEIISSKFYFEKSMFSDDPVADIELKNNTGETISEASFDAALTSEGREVPWLEAPITYEIPGGLKNGEKAHWKLDMNSFSDWGKVQNRNDFKLTLKVNELLGADKKPLWNASFNKEKEEEIKELKTKIKSFNN